MASQFTQQIILDWKTQFVWSFLHMKSKEEINDLNFFLFIISFPSITLPASPLAPPRSSLTQSIMTIFFSCASQCKWAQKLIGLYVYVRVPRAYMHTNTKRYNFCLPIHFLFLHIPLCNKNVNWNKVCQEICDYVCMSANESVNSVCVCGFKSIFHRPPTLLASICRWFRLSMCMCLTVAARGDAL